MIVTIAAILLILLLFLNVPVYTSLVVAALEYFAFSDVNIMIIAQKMARGLENTTLLAIPFFICSGILMNYGGIADRLFEFCKLILGHWPGSLAQVNVDVYKRQPHTCRILGSPGCYRCQFLYSPTRRTF